MERERCGTLERVPRTPQNFSRIIWLSGIGTVARFRAFLIFLSRRLQGGWRAAPVPGGGVPFWLPAYSAFSLLSRPHPPDPARRALFPAALAIPAPGRGPSQTPPSRATDSSSPPVPPLLGCRHCSEKRSSAGFALNRRLPFAGHLYGRDCKCRKQSNTGVPGAEPPAK